MFTGIISDLGKLRSICGRESKRLSVYTGFLPDSMALGASIACNGICLTVVDKGTDDHGHWFAADASPHTLEHTTLRHWREEMPVNLERALQMGDELGGHMVTGHVDGVATITDKTKTSDAINYQVECPKELARFIAAKGSVTLDGVSLTVTHAAGNQFSLTLIPHTLSVTNWQNHQVTSQLNLEVDLMARYVSRML